MPAHKKLCNLLSTLLIMNVTVWAVTTLGVSTTRGSVQAQTGDITPPTTTHTLTPSTPDGNNGWYVSPVQIELSATDLESGVKTIYYRIDGGAWKTASFTNTQNLAPNPSFETTGATSSGLDSWEATVVDPEGTYSQDSTSAPAYPNNSAKIDAIGGTWHGINNQTTYVSATPFDNMTASAWLKTQSVAGSAFFKVYAVSPDGSGGVVYTELAQSPSVSGTVGWTKVTSSFTVAVPDAIGVYIDIGLVGPGTLWTDAVELNSSSNAAATTFTVATDSILHTIEYYSVDVAGNSETYSCSGTIINCIQFKSDQTEPGKLE